MKKLLTGVLVVVAAVGLGGTVSAHRNHPQQPSSNYEYFCHRTNSATNPYTKVPFSNTFSEVDGQGGSDHTLHKGPVVSTEAQANFLKFFHIKWGDIIPPVNPYLPSGYNWSTKGQSVYNNDCNYPPVVEQEPNIEYNVACSEDKTEVVVTLTNTGNGSGTVTVNGEEITVDPDQTVVRNFSDGTTVTISYPGDDEPRYSEQVKCQTGGSGGEPTPEDPADPGTVAATQVAAAQLPSTSGANYAALLGAISVAAVAVSFGGKRLITRFF